MTNILQALQDHQQVMADVAHLVPQIEEVAEYLVKTVQNNRKIFWMGNGGSAADAQHLAAELIGRFKQERPAIPSIALTTDTSILTCISNDYDFNKVFSRQIEALCHADDVVIGISTSGNSKNILNGIQAAKEKGAFTIGLTGKTGGQLAQLADCCLQIPSDNTARIQEAHIFIGHCICEWIENKLVAHVAIPADAGI